MHSVLVGVRCEHIGRLSCFYRTIGINWNRSTRTTVSIFSPELWRVYDTSTSTLHYNVCHHTTCAGHKTVYADIFFAAMRHEQCEGYHVWYFCAVCAFYFILIVHAIPPSGLNSRNGCGLNVGQYYSSLRIDRPWFEPRAILRKGRQTLATSGTNTPLPAQQVNRAARRAVGRHTDSQQSPSRGTDVWPRSSEHAYHREAFASNCRCRIEGNHSVGNGRDFDLVTFWPWHGNWARTWFAARLPAATRAHRVVDRTALLFRNPIVPTVASVAVWRG